jgi:hypothetical protein
MSSKAEIIDFPHAEQTTNVFLLPSTQHHVVELIIRDDGTEHLPPEAFEEAATASTDKDHAVEIEPVLGDQNGNDYYLVSIHTIGNNIIGAVRDCAEAFVETASHYKDIGWLGIDSSMIDGHTETEGTIDVRGIFLEARNQILQRRYMQELNKQAAEKPVLRLIKSVEPEPLVA